MQDGRSNRVYGSCRKVSLAIEVETRLEPGRLTGFMSRRIERAGLSSTCDKVLSGERLNFDDGVRLYESRDLLAVGQPANIVRERKNGNLAYFNRNLHINYTNICNKMCTFCAFDRLPGEEGGYTMYEDEIAARFK